MHHSIQVCQIGDLFWARIFKVLRSPRINFKEPIPPGCVAWRAGTITLFLLGSYSPHRLFKNSSTEELKLGTTVQPFNSRKCTRSSARYLFIQCTEDMYVEKNVDSCKTHTIFTYITFIQLVQMHTQTANHQEKLVLQGSSLRNVKK